MEKLEKNSFLMYTDYEEHFNLLTDEEVGKLMRAIIKYEKTREVPDLGGMAKMAFSFIKTQLDLDRKKYEIKCDKNKENGRRGGRPKKEEKQEEKNEIEKPNGFENNRTVSEKPNGFFENPKNPIMINDNENENENDNDNVISIINSEEVAKIDKLMIECLNTTNTNNILECTEYLSKIPIELIEYGLKKASRVTNPSWKYAMKILDDYVRKKFTKLEQVKADELKFKSETKKKDDKKSNFENRKYESKDFKKLYANIGRESNE